MSDSPLSEAVEQAARAASLYLDDLTAFGRHQADRLASGHYGLTDLTTAQVRLLRIGLQHSQNMMRTLTDNIALLSYDGPTGGSAPRTIRVPVPVPAQTGVVLRVSELVGDGGHRIPRSRLQLDPRDFPPAQAPMDALVTVTVESAGAPAGTYAGTIHTDDGAVSVGFRLAIDDLGTPLP
jgi:hypothetical protein